MSIYHYSLNLMTNQSMKIVYVNDYTSLMSIVYALIIWRWTSRHIIDFVRIIDSHVSRMIWDYIDSFIKIDRNLFSTLQQFKSTYFFNSDVNDSRQIIWCCRNYSIDDLIKRFRCLNAWNIILKKSFWKNLKCINIICDKSSTIDYETCFISSINNWCNKIYCIIDDTWKWFNKCWKLINYFYYEKYVMKKNNIFFRHIDQNISQLISFERDVNMIQDILSLNDENINNYIVILFDMHHHLLFWWKWMISRDLTLNNYIHRIIDQIYIKNDVKNFNSSWTNIICKRENVRITLFSLFHENVELTQFIRRMLLSWFVNVKKNDETLKNIEIDIWFELTIVHRDLIAIRCSFFEFFNYHEAISYHFSSTTEITDLDTLSNAILYRSK
jgi:hypothetical protein